MRDPTALKAALLSRRKGAGESTRKHETWSRASSTGNCMTASMLTSFGSSGQHCAELRACISSLFSLDLDGKPRLTLEPTHSLGLSPQATMENRR